MRIVAFTGSANDYEYSTPECTSQKMEFKTCSVTSIQILPSSNKLHYKTDIISQSCDG